MKPTPEPMPSLAARLAEQSRAIEGLQQENESLRQRVRELERMLEQRGGTVSEPSVAPPLGEAQPRPSVERRTTLQGIPARRAHKTGSLVPPPEAKPREPDAEKQAEGARVAAGTTLPDGGQWGVLALDNRGRVVAQNRLAVELFSLPPGITGRRLFEEVRPDLAGSPLHLAFLNVVKGIALGNTSPLRVKLPATAGKPALTAVIAQRAGAAEQITLVVQKDERLSAARAGRSEAALRLAVSPRAVSRRSRRGRGRARR